MRDLLVERESFLAVMHVTSMLGFLWFAIAFAVELWERGVLQMTRLSRMLIDFLMP
jgi:hypothetical protein